jgi:hypothetical protein
MKIPNHREELGKTGLKDSWERGNDGIMVEVMMY